MSDFVLDLLVICATGRNLVLRPVRMLFAPYFVYGLTGQSAAENSNYSLESHSLSLTTQILCCRSLDLLRHEEREPF